MSVQNAIAAVYGLLKTAPGLGPNVYDSIYYSNDETTFKSLFMDSQTDPAHPIVHTWMVTREATPAKDDFMQAMSRTHSIVMVGYRSFQNGVTEPLWQAEVDAIADLFSPYAARRFNNQFDWSGPPSVENVKPVFFGNYLCHMARIVHPVREFPIP